MDGKLVSLLFRCNRITEKKVRGHEIKMKSFESSADWCFQILFFFLFKKKKPCIKQVFDQDSSPQSLLPPLLFGFSNSLDGDFICGLLKKREKWKIDHKRRVQKAQPWQHSNLAALSSYPFLPSRINSWLQDFFFLASPSPACHFDLAPLQFVCCTYWKMCSAFSLPEYI